MSTEAGDGRKAAFGRLSAGSALKAIGLGIRLIPSALFRLNQGHRRFSGCFIEELTRCGVPERDAREMAREMRPGLILKAIRQRGQPADQE